MKKTLLAAAIGGALTLSGCDSDGINSAANPSPDSIPQTTVKFDPATGQLSTPTDFLISPTTGLLDIPADKEGDIYDSLRSLDGWGLSSPIVIEMTFPDRKYGTVQLDKASLGPDAFVLLEGQTPLQYEKDYTLKASSSGLVIIPTRPFKPSQQYLFAVTDTLEDALDRPVAPSQMFTLLSNSETDVSTLTSDPTLQGKLSAIQAGLVQVTTALAPLVGDDTIVYAGSYTTQSVGNVLTEVMNQIDTASPSLANVSAVADLKNYLMAAGKTEAEADAAKGANPVISSGELTLPYYLEVPTDSGGMTSFWKNSDGVSPRPGNYAPVKQSDQTVPVFISVPQGVAPTGGWPVALYVHGITSYKETAAAIAGNLAAQGVALVAIDLPLHGARSLDFDADNVYDVTATDPDNGDAYDKGSPLVFANLGALRTVRDNLKQSISDILTLRRALEGNSLNLNDNKVSLLGVSLGSIIGTGVLGVSDSYTANTNFEFNAAALTVGGSQAAAIMGYSNSFGPDVKTALQANDAFAAAVAENLGYSAAELIALRDGNDADQAQYQRLADLAYDSFASGFIAVSQQVIDSADAVAWAGKVQSDTPVLATQIIGNGVVLSDQTVPNSTLQYGFPLGGTSPWLALMKLNQTSSALSAGPVKAHTNFMLGKHGSLLDPSADPEINLDAASAAAATAEMQAQVISFIASDGTLLQGSATDTNGTPTGNLNTNVVQ